MNRARLLTKSTRGQEMRKTRVKVKVGGGGDAVKGDKEQEKHPVVTIYCWGGVDITTGGVTVDVTSKMATASIVEQDIWLETSAPSSVCHGD